MQEGTVLARRGRDQPFRSWRASLAAEVGWQTITCRGDLIDIDPDSITDGHASRGCACGLCRPPYGFGLAW